MKIKALDSILMAASFLLSGSRSKSIFFKNGSYSFEAMLPPPSLNI